MPVCSLTGTSRGVHSGHVGLIFVHFIRLVVGSSRTRPHPVGSSLYAGMGAEPIVSHGCFAGLPPRVFPRGKNVHAVDGRSRPPGDLPADL